MDIKKSLLTFLLLFITAGVGGGIWWVQKTAGPPKVRTIITAAELLSEDVEGFARTEGAWPFSFPEDHGAHPDYRMESWYFLGNLATGQGRRFGFQLTFFRVSLAPEVPRRASAWATNQVYKGHLAVTDVAQNRFHAFERFSRAALGLSGAEESPARVWLEDWAMEFSGNKEQPGFYLWAAEDDIRLDLSLQGTKPMVLPGMNDLSSLNGSFHFYLMPRLLARGTLQIGADTFDVEGPAWLDRAWGFLPLPQGPVALNRFVLQLDDGRELLGFQFHRRDGGARPVNTGLLVLRDGAARGLGQNDISIEVVDHWTSPQDGTRYPARWRLRIPTEEIDLDIVPYIANQELNLSTRYWGGAVRVMGNADSEVVGGAGYVELTGYAREGIHQAATK